MAPLISLGLQVNQKPFASCFFMYFHNSKHFSTVNTTLHQAPKALVDNPSHPTHPTPAETCSLVSPKKGE